jgi:hypothetical protein
MPRLLVVHHTPSPALQEMFEAAVSGHPGLARSFSPRHQLPRWFVTITGPREFERGLASRFDSLPRRVISKAMARVRGRR